MRNAPLPRERAIVMQEIANYGIPTYVTCEPLMQFDLAELVELVGMCSPQQVNIGRNSRYDITLPEPTADEVKMLKAELEKFTKVEVKANAYCWMRKYEGTNIRPQSPHHLIREEMILTQEYLKPKCPTT